MAADDGSAPRSWGTPEFVSADFSLISAQPHARGEPARSWGSKSRHSRLSPTLVGNPISRAA